MSLFNKKTIERQVAIASPPDSTRVAALRDWASDITSGKIASHSEVSLHGPFVQKILVEALGYRGPIGNERYNVTQEQGIFAVRSMLPSATSHKEMERSSPLLS